MTTRKWSVKNAARVTGAGITAVLAIAALGVVGVSGQSFEFGQDLNTPIEQNVVLPNQIFEVVCAPGVETEVGAAGSGQVTVSETDGIEVLQATDLGSGEEIAATKSGELTVYKSKSPVGLTVRSQSDASFLALSRSEASEDVRGMVIDQCQPARGTSWFTVGATTVGESALLTVSNPSQQATQVTVSGWSATGPLEETPTFTVSAQSTETVNLAAYFPENERLGIQVEATGPGAVSTIRTVGMDGLAPQGIDAITGTDTASNTVGLVGLEKDLEDPKLRLLNPGDNEINAEVTLLTEDGLMGLSGSEAITLDPGAVFQLSLDGLATDVATVVINASEPILASMSATAVGKPNEDGKPVGDRIVWVPSQAATEFATLVPSGGDKTSSVLNIANPNEDVVEVTINGKSHEIGPLSMTAQKVSAGEVLVESDRPVYASLTSIVDRADGKIVSNVSLTDAGETVPATKLVVEH